MYIKLLFLVLSLIVIAVMSSKLFLKKKSVKSAEVETEIKPIKKGDYIKKDDANAQINYEANKNKVLDFLNLNVKDKLELSWQFLYEITDIVLKKFNSQDKNMVHTLGKQLFKSGMQYEHVVDYGINRDQLRKNKNQSQTITR
jgi:hypothetical protein